MNEDFFVFNENKTVTSFLGNPSSLIYPYTPHQETFRGGMFWCIPNQGPPYALFSVQNGEYRKQSGDFTKIISGVWGMLEAKTSWEKRDFGFTTKAELTALSDKTEVRPGFHPYFNVADTFTIQIGETVLEKEDIAEGVIFTYVGNTAFLQSADTNISIRGDIDKEDASVFFSIWTDNKNAYVCIEPVYGKDLLTSDEVSPLTLTQGEQVTCSVTVTKEI